MSHEELRDDLARTGRFPPAEFTDFWEGVERFSNAYARRRHIPREDLLWEVYADLYVTIKRNTPAFEKAETEFKEKLRALYKRSRLVADRLAREAAHRRDADHPGDDRDLDDAPDSPADASSRRHPDLAEPDGPSHLPARRVKEKTVPACPEEYTTQESSTFLGCSRSHILKLIKTGKLNVRMVGNSRRLLVSELVEYRAKSFAKAESALDDLSLAVTAEIEARGPTERSLDVSP